MGILDQRHAQTSFAFRFPNSHKSLCGKNIDQAWALPAAWPIKSIERRNIFPAEAASCALWLTSNQFLLFAAKGRRTIECAIFGHLAQRRKPSPFPDVRSSNFVAAASVQRYPVTPSKTGLKLNRCAVRLSRSKIGPG